MTKTHLFTIVGKIVSREDLYIGDDHPVQNIEHREGNTNFTLTLSSHESVGIVLPWLCGRYPTLEYDGELEDD